MRAPRVLALHDLSDQELLRRCWEFMLEINEAIAERVEDLGDGLTAVIDTRIPLVRDSNYVVAEREVRAEEIAARADEAFGELGIEHRHAHARDPAYGAQMSEGLERLGWVAETDVVQVLRRELDRQSEVEVERASLDEVWEVNRAIMSEDPEGTPELIEQIMVRERQTEAAFDDRWFAARHEGEIASCCRLTQKDGIGQVEDVSTLKAGRNRGLARAVSLEAARVSVQDGDEITFVVAYANEWPRKLYERLGFDPVGETTSAQREPG